MAIRSTSRGRIPEMDGLRALAIGASSVAAGSLSWHFFERPLSCLPKLQMWREAPAS